MTLNITVLSPMAIYQSADFRLTKLPGGVLITDKSPKTVILQYSTWIGSLTYTGLGSWAGKPISGWVTDWLADGSQRTMAEVAAHLEAQATKLFQKVNRVARQAIGHTFVIAGFEDGVVRAFVVSNFEDCFGNYHAVTKHFTTSSRHVSGRSGAAALITGQATAIPVVDKKVLAKLALNYPDDGGRIRRRIQTMNAAAAVAPETDGTVSEECVVVSFRFDGLGILEFSSPDGTRPLDIPRLTNGVDMNGMKAEAMKRVGLDMSGAQLSSATFATLGGPGPSGVLESSCTVPVGNGDPDGLYRVTEVDVPDFELMSGTAVTDSGHIAGTGRGERQSPWITNVPWMMRDGELTRIDVNGFAQSINGAEQVALMINDIDGPRAGLYADGAVWMFSLDDGAGGVIGDNSFAAAINGSGAVAGSVNTRTDVPGENNTRAAVFFQDSVASVFTGLVVEHGARAVDINDRGEVLVAVSPDHFQTRAILWRPQDDKWSYVGGEFANVAPVALTEDGVVLGNDNTSLTAVICKPGGAWENLGTDPKWSATGINNSGCVVGIVMQDNQFRPWLRLATGRIVMLPYIIGHHTEAKAINAAGQIVGGASADHGGHALIWSPEQ